jgi:hypothetical protein
MRIHSTFIEQSLQGGNPRRKAGIFSFSLAGSQPGYQIKKQKK